MWLMEEEGAVGIKLMTQYGVLESNRPWVSSSAEWNGVPGNCPACFNTVVKRPKANTENGKELCKYRVL